MVQDSGNPDLSLWVQALRLFLELDSTLQLHSSGPGLLEVLGFPNWEKFWDSNSSVSRVRGQSFPNETGF